MKSSEYVHISSAGEITDPAAIGERAVSRRFEGRPVRILHVLGGMDRGGVETWLMHVLRHIDRQQFQMDFLVHTDRRCDYDDEIETLGSKIYFCPDPRNPLRYAWNFRRIVREYGPYDVVHSHVHHFSGFVLRLAKAAGVPQRIAHSHTDTSSLDVSNSLYRALYVHISRHLIQGSATWKLGASRKAANNLFGSARCAQPNTLVLECGLDLEPFTRSVDRAAVRREIGLSPDEFVIGHVGRLVPVKNHNLLLRIHAEILRTRPDARLLLVGEGPLDNTIREMASALGLSDRVRFAGGRSDVAQLMLGAMDVFVMPSKYEGLGLAAIEAQAAGVPTILSDQIPAEADTKCGLVRFVQIGKSEAFWAHEILQHFRQKHISQAQAVMQVRNTHFNLERNLGKLTSLYQSHHGPGFRNDITSDNR